jgi:hypothetical protein
MESGLMDSFSITITSCFFFALPPAKKNFGLPARVISAQAHPVPARDRRPPGEGGAPMHQVVPHPVIPVNLGDEGLQQLGGVVRLLARVELGHHLRRQVVRPAGVEARLVVLQVVLEDVGVDAVAGGLQERRAVFQRDGDGVRQHATVPEREVEETGVREVAVPRHKAGHRIGLELALRHPPATDALLTSK